MYLEKPKSGGDFSLPEAGTHIAVCWRVVDLGTQNMEFQGEHKQQRKVLLSWELPEELIEIDGEKRPMVMSQRYTFSMHEKATFRQHLESWRGRKFGDEDFGPTGFNVKKLLGVGCFLSVVHSTKGEKTYANITGVSKLTRGQTVAATVNPHTYFSMQNPDDYDAALFGTFPDWLQEVIKKSPEWQNIDAKKARHDPPGGSERVTGTYDDDIPF